MASNAFAKLWVFILRAPVLTASTIMSMFHYSKVIHIVCNHCRNTSLTIKSRFRIFATRHDCPARGPIGVGPIHYEHSTDFSCW